MYQVSHPLLALAYPLSNIITVFNLINPNQKPMVIEIEGIFICFVERVSKYKVHLFGSEIGYLEVTNGDCAYKSLVLDRPYLDELIDFADFK